MKLVKYDLSQTAEEVSNGLATGILFKARRIFLSGEVDDEMAERFIIRFQALDHTKGDIFISMTSEGGEMDAGFAIYDAIKGSNNRVIIDVIGGVRSAAALILQAADHRRMVPNARLMIHHGTMHIHEATLNAVDLEIHHTELNINNKRCVAIFAEHSHMTVEEINKLCERDSFFSAEESLARGLVDEILVPKKVKKVKHANS